MTAKKQDEKLIKINELTADFIKFIHERLGIVIKQHQAYELNKTILAACNKFNMEPEEYLTKIINAEEHSPLLEHLISGVTVGETYFFRDQSQMNLLKNRILTHIIQKKRQENNLSLRIWSAGAATGEEIYTLVMLLCEALPDIEKWRLNLLATDINTEALKKGIAGVYGEWSMRSIQDYFKQRYFTKNNKEYSLSPKLKELVQFEYLNLNEDAYPTVFNGTNAQDLILCRNVFIYFDINKITLIMKKLNACLVPGGYLLLGASDPVILTDTDLIFHHQDGLVFTRPTADAHEVPVKKPIVIEERQPIKINYTIPEKPKIILETKVVEQSYQTKIKELLQLSNWQEILNLTNQAIVNDNNSSFLLSSKAIALANLGKIADAEKICQESLNHHSIDKTMCFTYALILIELNRLAQAEKVLRQTLFLDHQFVPAHFQLGLLLLRNKQHDAGLKCLSNALIIAQTKNKDEEVIGSQGLHYGQLVDILKHEIEIHTLSGNMSYANENA